RARGRGRQRDRGVGGQVAEDRRGELYSRRVKEARRLGVREQRRYFGTERLVTGARMGDVGSALFGSQFERPVENLGDLPPPGGGRSTRRTLPQTIDSAKMRTELGRRKYERRSDRPLPSHT